MGGKIREVIVLQHLGKPGLPAVRRELEKIFKIHGVKARWVKSIHAHSLDDLAPLEKKLPGQMVIACGGDGTLLQAARLARARSLPIVGVNLGTLGFLATVPKDAVSCILPRILAGNYSISQRLALEFKVKRQGKVVTQGWAMNDVVIGRGGHSHMIRLCVKLSQGYAAEFHCDGLIIATSTGSTAYSLSAGGPIISPKVDALAVTPICAHSLTNRPIVVSGSEKIFLRIPLQSPSVLLQTDGLMGARMKPGDLVEVSASRKPVSLVHLPETDFYRVVSEKLKWSGASF